MNKETIKMNVGSILNGELQLDKTRPDESPVSEEAKPSVSTHQRHLINNLLNDPAPQKSEAESTAMDRQKTASDVKDLEDELTRAVEEFDDKLESSASPKSPNQKASPKQKSSPKGRRSPKQSPKQSPKDSSNGNKEGNRGSSVVDEKEIATINKLKAKSKGRKPTRYKTPPIWAQEWVPQGGHRNGGGGGNGPGAERALHGYADARAAAEAGGNGGPGSVLSEKHVFDRSLAFSADLECSITGVIPPPSVVRTVAEWIYANFVEISLENRRHVELELKFGTIIAKATGRRLDIGVSTECIYTRPEDIKFEMGVHEVGWKDMTGFLGELEKAFQDDKKRNNNSNSKGRKFQTLETDDTDLFYQISERNEHPRKVRITKDNTLVPPRYVGIEKRRILDLYIHCPSSMYDLRFSLLFEFPVDENSIEPTMKKYKPVMTRVKKRSSWSHVPTITKFDFTKVSTPKTSRNKAGKTVVESETTHEVELEIDPVEIFRGFDKIRDGSDTIRFEELVEVFLNNARCLNNRVTKLASK